MEDKVCYLTNLGIPTIAITNDEDADNIQQVLNVKVEIVCTVSTSWPSSSFVRSLLG